MKTRIAGLAFLSIIAALGTGCLAVEREYWDCRESSCVMTGGEVKNNTDSFYTGVKVTATYYDETGRTFSAAAQTCTDIINPHDSSPFMMSPQIPKSPASPTFKTTGYQLAFEGEPATDVLPNYLTVSDIAFESWGPYGFRMEATIQNSGAVIYDYPTVCTAFYRDGVLVHLEPPSPYFPPGPLEPGESTGFRVDYWFWRDVPTEVRLWVKGVQRDTYGWVMPVSTGLIPIPYVIPPP
jgi:hypothetical protein